MLLARNILEQLTARGPLPLQDLRERLCCASEMRMSEAVGELRGLHLITVGDGKDVLVALYGDRRRYGAPAGK